MKTNLKARNVELDDRLRGRDRAKAPPARPHHPRIGRGRRRAHRHASHATDSAQVAEVTLRNNGEVVRSTASGATPIAALDVVIDKLERQVVRTKERPGSVREAAQRRGRIGPDPGGAAGRSRPMSRPAAGRQGEALRHAADVRGGRDHPDGGARTRLLRLPRRGDRAGGGPLSPDRRQLRRHPAGDRSLERERRAELPGGRQKSAGRTSSASDEDDQGHEVDEAGPASAGRSLGWFLGAIASTMARTVARPEPRRRLTWPEDAPAVGMHLGVGNGPAAGGPTVAADRRPGAPDLHRQPNGLASPPRATARGAGLRRLRRARGTADDRGPRVVPDQPGRLGRAVRVASRARA